MNLFYLAFLYLWSRPVASLFHLLLMIFGMGTITALLLFGQQLQDRFLKEAAGVDLVVGAKGSPLQLILSTIQHVDIPTGNIDYRQAVKLAGNQQIRTAIPLALGDRYHAWRIVGSDENYLRHFKAEFAEGQMWQAPMQVVIGADVARQSGLQIGSAMVGDHGLVDSGGAHVHDEHPYRVVGILKPTGRLVDRLILTSLQSVWDVHAEEQGGNASEKKEITALLIKYRNRSAAFSFPRQVNARTSFQAASPAFELARLVDLVGVGQDTLYVIGGVLVSIGLLGIAIGLLSAIRQRKYDLSLFRAMGAPPRKIFTLVLAEGMMIALPGSLLGMLFGHGLLFLLGQLTEKGQEFALQTFILVPEIYMIEGAVLILSALLCFIPAWEAYKTDIRNSLTGETG